MSGNGARRGLRVVLLGGLLVTGCGSSGTAPPALPDPVPFEGVVKLDGQPVESATVVFHPRSEKGFHGAMGTTDASGKYELDTDIGNNKTKKGALPGEYDVTVSRLVSFQDGSILKPDPSIPPMNRGARQSIPMKYATVNEFGLKCTVSSSGRFDIDMVSGGPF